MIYAFEPSAVRMRLFNADGSPSEVSGNGIRCLAALAVRERPGTSHVTIDTPAGQKVLELQGQDGDALTFRAAMGIPQDIRAIEIEAAGEKVQAVALSVGNPQCVLLDDPLLESRLHKLGPAIEHHPKFPDRTNVSFARVEAPDRVAHSDLGARRRADAGVGHGRLRRRGGRRLVRRRVAGRRSDLARRQPARRVARRRVVSDRLGEAGVRRTLVGTVSVSVGDLLKRFS